MTKDTINRLAALGSQTEEHLAMLDEVRHADLTLTALAVAIRVLGRVPPERERGDLMAMKLLFHELAGDDGEIWEERAAYLVDGNEGV